MISGQQFLRIARSQKIILPLLMFLSGAWQVLYVVILSSSSLRKLMEAYMAIMPDAFRRFMSFMGAGFSAKQFLAFGYTHPSMLFVLTFIPVAVAGRFITGEIEGRSVEILVLRVFPKYKLLVSAWMYTVCAHALIFISMAGGTVAAQMFTGINDGLTLHDLIRIVFTGMLFFTAVNSIITALAALFSSRGKTMAWGIGFMLTAFIFDALVKVWEQADFLKSWSLFHWYQPVDVVNGRYDYVTGGMITVSLIVVSLLFAIYYFEKRDV